MHLFTTIREKRIEVERRMAHEANVLYLGFNHHEDLCRAAETLGVRTFDGIGEPIPHRYDGMTVHRVDDSPDDIGFGIDLPPT